MMLKFIYTAMLVAIMAIVPLAAVHAQTAGCTPPLVANRWQPFVALAGPQHTGPAAINYLGQTLALQQRALMFSHPGPKITKLKGRVYKSLRSFDLSGLYDMLPDTGKAPWHSITVTAIPDQKGYRVMEAPPATISTTPSPYGALYSQFEMQPVNHSSGPSGARYAIRTTAKMDTGILRWPSVLQAMQLALADTAKPASIRISQKKIKAIQATSDTLSDYDARILAQFAEAFPASFAWFSKIGHVSDLSLTGDRATHGPYHLYVAIQLDDKALEKRYPHVEDYLKRLGNFMHGNFDIDNAAGRWMNVHFDTAKRRLTANLWVAHGLPIPSNNGQPSGTFSGRKIADSMSWKTYANLYFSALGINVALTDWRGQWQYEKTASGMQMTGFFNNQPGVTVTGKALHILPASWMEALLPVNVKDAVTGFMQVLAHSNGGKGAKFHATLTASDNADSIATAKASATALDNFFVRFGMAMLSHRVLPDSDQANGLRKMINDGLGAYRKDLVRMVKLTHGTATANVPAACSTGSS